MSLMLSLDPALQQPLHAFTGEDLVRRFVNNGAVGGPAANGMACVTSGVTNRPGLPDVTLLATSYYWTMTAVAYLSTLSATSQYVLGNWPGGAATTPGASVIFRGTGRVSAVVQNTSGLTAIDGPTTVAGKLYAMTLVRRNNSYGFYVNGEEINAAFSPAGAASLFTQTVTVGENTNSGGSSAKLNGGVSLAMFHDHDLSAQAIIDLQSVLLNGEYQEDIGFLGGLGPEFDLSTPEAINGNGARSAFGLGMPRTLGIRPYHPQ